MTTITLRYTSNMNGFIIEKNNPEVLYNSIQKLLNAKSKLRTIQEYNVSVSEISTVH